MIRTLFLGDDQQRTTSPASDEIDALLRVDRGALWLDFEGEPPEVCEPILRETFGFHPLAIDDALQETHVPKIDDWEDYLYIVLHAVTFRRSDDDGQVETIELDIFLGRNYIVTHHDLPIAALNHVWSNCQRDKRYLARGVDHLMYLLSDELANSYMTAADEMDDALDAVEVELFDRPSRRY